MHLDKARQIAENLITMMAPCCERVKIAGSIRRGKDEVRDIEIVAVPKWAMQPNPADLFGGEIDTNLLHEWAKTSDVRWIKPGTSEIVDWQPKHEGKYWRGILTHEGEQIKLDLFLCTPRNWGTVFLIRTGSADFSHAVAIHAQRMRRNFANGFLTMSGVSVETFEESDVFRLLELEFTEPAARIDANSLRRAKKETR